MIKIRKIFLSSSTLLIAALMGSTVMSAQNNASITNAKIGSVENDLFTTQVLKSQALFGFKTEGSHSYRIPGVLVQQNGNILVNADQRLENIEDYNNTINQVFKQSNDKGETWSSNNTIVKVATPKTGKGLIIDGTFAEVEYEKSKTKLLFLFNIFAERAGIVHLLKGNPWVYVGNEKYLKLWVKKANNQFDSQSSILKRVPGKENWFRQYKLPNGVNHQKLTANTQLIPTDTYIDMSYNAKTKAISGQVFENVLQSEINDKNALAKKATNHSVFDNYNNAKYFLAKNNHNAMLESYDNGLTWQNLSYFDEKIGNHPDRSEPFSGNAVGSGIQLKNQKNPKLNGRVFFTMYNFVGGVQKPYLIYSDDFGETWNKVMFNNSDNLTESTLIETKDGEIYYTLRQSVWGKKDNTPFISKSTDGGLTWKNPKNPNSNQQFAKLPVNNVDGNVFSGVASFELKGKSYFVYALPKGNFRKAGSLFVSDKDLTWSKEILSFDTKNQEHFAYSYVAVVENGTDYVDVLVVYEWSPHTKIFNQDQHFNSRPKGGGIQVDKIRIKLK
ncbi:exo-alpha-sialidase [Candidatus Mycoplasma pogonae]